MKSSSQARLTSRGTLRIVDAAALPDTADRDPIRSGGLRRRNSNRTARLNFRLFDRLVRFVGAVFLARDFLVSLATVVLFSRISFGSSRFTGRLVAGSWLEQPI